MNLNNLFSVFYMLFIGFLQIEMSAFNFLYSVKKVVGYLRT
jgi:hypothetical protein